MRDFLLRRARSPALFLLLAALLFLAAFLLARIARRGNFSRWAMRSAGAALRCRKFPRSCRSR